MKRHNSRCFPVMFVLIFLFFGVKGQDTLNGPRKQQFFYPGGALSSEGTMKEGKPEGYWVSYYENGKIKAEGNRKNFVLDSLWKFYNEEEKLVMEINYFQGKKNGFKNSYLDKEIIRETFRNDIKDGFTRYYYPDGAIKMEVPFVQGQEQGFGREFAPDGTIITLTEYRKGFIVDRQRINRKDGNGRKQGKWYQFYPTGIIQTEGSYKDDLKNGYFKEYAENGDLLKIYKYVEGVLQPEAAEIKKPDVRNEYYPGGKIRSSTMYRNGVMDGIRRVYDTTGKIEQAFIYCNGVITGEGIVKEDGNRDGFWKEYYPDGSLKSEGRYDNGTTTGEWKFYHANGKTEQTGKYNKQGKPEGVWRWYFPDGQLLREEEYRRGLHDGVSVTYDETGMVIEEGEFVNGKEEGLWIEKTGTTYIKGTYRDGQRNGMWYYYYLDAGPAGQDSLCFYKGNFIEDNPDGRHYSYWENGKVKDEGLYVMGKREGDWMKYNYDGTLFMIITYRNGAEIRYDGIRIKPPFESEED